MIASEAENLFLALSDETLASNPYQSDVANDPEPWEAEAQANFATAAPSAQTDDPVELYFRDIRQHDLLSVGAERDLWRRIERHKARMRRALCLSPVALQTLTRLCNQVKHGEIQIQEVVTLRGDEALPVGMLEHLSDTVAQLHELATDLSLVPKRVINPQQ